MLAGAPLLAIYDATGTFRTFELSAGVFTQIATQGGFDQNVQPGGDTYPFFAWAGDQIVVVKSNGGTNRSITLLDILLSTVASTFQNAGASSATYRVGFAKDIMTLAIMAATGSTGTIPKVLVQPGALIAEAHANLAALGAMESVAPSHDGAKWAQLRGAAIGNIRNPGFNQAFVNDGTKSPVRASRGAWDATGRFLIAGTPGDAYATVFRYDSEVAAGYVETFQIENPAHALVCIAASPYGKHLAIGWLAEGVYTTIIYVREGAYYRAIQTLTGYGRLLNFSGDGSILVDAGARKTAVLNTGTGLYADNTDMAANLPTGTVAQAVSDHAPVVLATANTYQKALDLVATGAFDPDSMKLTLATASAPAFDVAHATLADTLGAAEVVTGGWPVGGIAVVNPSFTSGSGIATVTADPFERTVIISDMVYRYAVLHIAGVPLVRYDFQTDVTVSKDSKAVFTVASDGILNFIA